MNAARARQLLEQAREEFLANARLRLGFWAAAGIFLFYGVLVLSDLRAARADEVRQLAQQANRTAAVLEAADWQARAAEARQRRETIESRFWRADSRGIARAELENWLRERAREAGMEQLRIEVESAAPVEGHPGLWRVGAQVQARHHGGVIRRWLGELAATEKMLLLERFEASERARSRTWVYAWFHIPEAGDGDGQ
jgi:hypothetical protein